MHALPLAFPEREHFFPSNLDGPLLEGPLAAGEGPPTWLAELELARQLDAASKYPRLCKPATALARSRARARAEAVEEEDDDDEGDGDDGNEEDDDEDE